MRINRGIGLLCACLALGGCITTRDHAVRMTADKFIGTVPGFGEINVENFRYWKAPARGREGQTIYELPEMFWKDIPESERR